MSDYTKSCPKCEDNVEFNFAGNNGYVGFCKKCQALLYYCSILGKIDFFKPTGEKFEVSFIDFKTTLQKVDDVM